MRVFPLKGAPHEARPESLAELRAAVAGVDNVMRATVDRALSDAVELIEMVKFAYESDTSEAVRAQLWLDNYRDFVEGAVHEAVSS